MSSSRTKHWITALIVGLAAGSFACGDDEPSDGDADADADGEADGDGDEDEDQDQDIDWTPVERVFPDGFLFGTAIAGFQAEMGCPTIPPEECEDRSSDWYVFITAPETLESGRTHLTGHPPTAGPGHWELYEGDFDLAADELHNNALRMSIEWSRIFPVPTDGIEGFEALRAVADEDAIAHYHAVFAALRERGLEPLVTLNHYSLPTWIHDTVACHRDLATCSPRGWLDRERTVREIAKYAGFVAEEFGGEVDLWATLNEPFAVLFPGYVLPSADRSNPPAAMMAYAEAREVFVALIEGHARMYDAVKAADLDDADGDGEVSRVGVVYAVSPVRPADPAEPLDVTAAENVFYLWNAAYLNAVCRGDLDDDLDGDAEHRDDLADRMDYVGVNYYTRVTVEGVRDPVMPELSPLTTFNPLGIEPWEDYPRGLYEAVVFVTEEFGLPTIITENGAADPADDGTGASWIVRHMTWAHQAIEDGADLRGYFYWTLMDNYEWNHGMDIRMGLYAVDRNDPAKVRVARRSVPIYGEIAGTGAISVELSALYPAP
jgi:beta-glucosidase/6-phospho-beta-glucosidase/beta-galactosidase